MWKPRTKQLNLSTDGASCAMLALLVFGALSPGAANASCFCVLRSTAVTGDPSYNPAAAVFVVRDGVRTVLTVEAAYRGPTVPLSMIVPVPHPVTRADVRTTSGSVFRRLDELTAPRVVHAWPRCPVSRSGAGDATDGVRVDDAWKVDEYDITVLGAERSAGLLAYLAERQLALPPEAAPLLRSYIESGHHFVFAQVDPSRAQRVGGVMVLSPLQIEFESESLRVPVRLGTLNSPGSQVLLLYIASPEGRFRVLNRPEHRAPTDVRLGENAVGSAAELYEGLMAELFRQHPGAAVTEYAHLIGRHVRRAMLRELEVSGVDDRRRWTLTRIRHRYGSELDDDLRLAPAPPLRLTRRWRLPQLNEYAPPGQSGFSTRYVVRHDGLCPGPEAQSRIARRYATAESMWASDGPLWPGATLVEPVPALGIEPGSTSPPGWPPAPQTSEPTTEAPTVDAPEANEPDDADEASEPDEEPTASTRPRPADRGWCAVRSGSSAYPAIALALVALLLIQRRRQTPG